MSKQAKITHLLTETVRVLCQSSFDDWSEMKIQGLLGITLNNKDIFLVQISEIIDSCFGGNNISQPCSNKMQYATNLGVTNDSKDSIDCSNVTAECSSYKQNLRSASKSVDKFSSPEMKKKISTRSKLSKPSTSNMQDLCGVSPPVLTTVSKQFGARRKNNGRRGWRKRTKFSAVNCRQQHQNELSKSMKHPAVRRKPLGKRKLGRPPRTSQAKKPNSIFRLEVSSSNTNSSDDSDEEQSIVDVTSLDEYDCKVCGKKFSKLTNLATHYTVNHSENISASCDAVSISEATSHSSSLGFVKCKNISCTRYFNSHNGMLKHHSRIHRPARVGTKRTLKSKNSRLVKRKKLFGSRGGIVTHHVHANGSSLVKTNSIVQTFSQDQQCSHCPDPCKDGVEIQPISCTLSKLSEISAYFNLENTSGCSVLKPDDLNVSSSVTSSVTSEIYDSVCKNLQSESTLNDQGVCIKELDLAETLIKKEEPNIIL